MIAAPAHWNHEPTRACVVCRFGRDDKGRPTRPDGHDAATCICPNVTGRNLPPGELPADWPLGMPVKAARANTGPCGPEAYHLTFRG